MKSKRPSRRKKDRGARRQRILDEAMMLLKEKGVEGWSMHRLAKALGYTVGALYRYFPNKDALVAELQCLGIDALGERLLELRGEVGRWAELHNWDGVLRALVELRVWVDCYEDFATSSSSLFRLNAMMLSDPRPLLDDVESLRVMVATQRVLGQVVSLVRVLEVGVLGENDAQEVDAKQVVDERRQAALDEEALVKTFVFWSALHGVVQMKKLMRFEPERWEGRSSTDEFLNTWLVGWGISTELRRDSRRWVERFWERVPREDGTPMPKSAVERSVEE